MDVCNSSLWSTPETRDLASTQCTATDAINITFVLASAYLVFFMQAGFAALVAGSVRAKSTSNVLILHILDPCVCAVLYYLIGYGFAFGQEGGFIGSSFFAFSPWTVFNDTAIDYTNNYGFWFFQYAFASAAATIVIGAVAERCSPLGYFCFSTLISGFVYPVVSHWVWSANGFLAYGVSGLFGSGALDFAGSGVVHLTGGTAAFWGGLIIGPRIGRYTDDGTAVDMPGHSMSLVALGTFLLWFGWYGFNPGSALIVSGNAVLVARTAVVMTLSAAAGGLSMLFLSRWTIGHFDLAHTANGVLAGLVGVTANCSYIEPWAGLLCGLTSAVVYYGLFLLFGKLKIDDPVAAAALHGGAGGWGVIFTGLLAKREFIQQYWGIPEPDLVAAGLFYGGSKAGRLLAANLIQFICTIAWTTAFMLPLFLVTKKLGILRISSEEEILGIDRSKHGGSAYVFDDNHHQLEFDRSKMMDEEGMEGMERKL
uniref:Ammonium transporter n=1 Tax=Compsopogon caeruleus TaxID=31354 RepID=A0A7S1XEM0_9RHOD|mmetsp:Transcript_5853/g.11557  ORF Transcript_5853/g.11557 Transcript_5853/m.11557 type:complete len:482 (+) Transcript_5853:243-1688(+)|eukprot:CAMPEP_0184680454 /NCGR_PEP_ID=MMETSP0312-20130426/3333_1 /TAXON_ID=31354 /ORGANISM="Compsopogon coeruleus, Strain SAG 36.94" /LENGTH=481 /DNA_ID=CAMNT_0027130567 /DNA_START=186 /DNA_END=1631 /DNA_ORIENTATION=+